jgi:hypothetical protein
MSAIEVLSRSLPERAEAIRRRYWRDAVFRGVCEDYGEACQVLNRLEAELAPRAMEIELYRELVAELLEEALQIIGDE